VGKRDVLAESTDRSEYALNMPGKLRILSEVRDLRKVTLAILQKSKTRDNHTCAHRVGAGCYLPSNFRLYSFMKILSPQ
jgi:hypothetical protein